MSKSRSKLSRTLRFVKYPLKLLCGLIFLLLFFSCLTPIAASTLGGYLGRKIGPSLGINKRALRNMDEALTDVDQKTITSSIAGMWENLGRVVGEMPHIRHIARWARTDQIEIINRNYLTRFQSKGQPVIYFSGHFANWELFPLILRELGVPTAAVYRAANNPIVDFYCDIFAASKVMIPSPRVPLEPENYSINEKWEITWNACGPKNE